MLRRMGQQRGDKQAGKQAEDGLKQLPQRQTQANDTQQAADTQKEIDRVREREGEDVARHAVSGQKEKQQHDVQRGGERVVAHATELLGKPLEHPVGDGVEI